MAASFNGTSQYLLADGVNYAGTIAPPLTMACWVKMDSFPATVVLFSLCTSSATDRFQLECLIGSRVFRAATVPSATAASTTTVSAGIWYHVVGRWNSTSFREIFVNGVNEGSNASTSAPSPITQAIIGARRNTTIGAFAPATLAEVGAWSAALSDAEILALSKGATPRIIRPQSLFFAPRLIREFIDPRSGLAISAVGSPTVSTHPRSYP